MTRGDPEEDESHPSDPSDPTGTEVSVADDEAPFAVVLPEPPRADTRAEVTDNGLGDDDGDGDGDAPPEVPVAAEAEGDDGSPPVEKMAFVTAENLLARPLRNASSNRATWPTPEEGCAS